MNNSSLIQLLRDGIDCADVLGMDWSHVRDTVVRTTIVYTYLQQLTAAHAAELAEKDAEIERLKGLLTIYFNAQQEKTK